MNEKEKIGWLSRPELVNSKIWEFFEKHQHVNARITWDYVSAQSIPDHFQVELSVDGEWNDEGTKFGVVTKKRGDEE